MIDKVKFINDNPNSALSARYLFELDRDAHDLAPKLINNSVFYDSWEAYFTYAENNGASVSKEVLVEAIQSTGLDPLSLPLWKRVINFPMSAEEKRELLLVALSVPIYSSRTILKAFRELSTGEKVQTSDLERNVSTMETVLMKETWPDRYCDLITDESRIKQKALWLSLIDVMLRELKSETPVVPNAIQIQRIDLAFRQMCELFKSDDSSWYQYACFQFNVLQDCEAAKKTIEDGIHKVSNSFILCNIHVVLSAGISESLREVFSHGISSNDFTLIQQRLSGENLKCATDKDSIENFRVLGKTAAANGISDARIYSQWWKNEAVVTKDAKMVERVLKNGMRCCQTSLCDSVLLGSEAMNYHLLRGGERECLGYAETQVESQTRSSFKKRQHAAWNALVFAERDLGLAFAKAAHRRDSAFSTDPLLSFVDRFRVGSYAPCTDGELCSIKLNANINREHSSAETQTIQGCDRPSREVPLCPPKTISSSTSVTIDLHSWSLYPLPPSSQVTSVTSSNPDDVVGPRSLKGRMGNRMVLNDTTRARCEREAKLRVKRGQAEDGDDAYDKSGLALLLDAIKHIKLEEKQEQRYRELSASWLMNYVVTKELNLRDLLLKR